MTQPSLKSIKPRCKCPGCSLWLRLEAERSDLSYKNTGIKVDPIAVQQVKDLVKTVTKVVYVDTKSTQERDLIMFNAGRYAAGARDDAAIKASNQLNQIIEGTTNDR
jgi:hypothetical protein